MGGDGYVMFFHGYYYWSAGAVLCCAVNWFTSVLSRFVGGK